MAKPEQPKERDLRSGALSQPGGLGRLTVHAGAPCPSLLSAMSMEVLVPGLAFLDAALRPGSDWSEIGESRVGWMTRIAVLPWLGAWRYSAGIRPRLDAAARAQRLLGA